MNSLLKEFKNFALRGNMVDLAIGVVIGASFSRVVNSLVSDIIMPPIGLLLGGMDFSALSLKLGWPGSPADWVEIKYGLFINSILDLFIISASIFFVIKIMNKLYRKHPVESSNKKCPHCLLEIPKKATKCGHCCSTFD